ncbi:MAG: YXWGXW repeat-containing protein [Deltaproteobacteria bacterium]
MDTRNFLYIRLTTSLVLGALICIASPAYAAAYDPSDENGVEVLSAGPVHEAFAEMVAFDPEPGITVRAIPPGRKWVPGYWSQTDTGVQWISGYWGLDNEVSTKYLPGPPASLEVGPNVPAPSSAYGWVPGCWIWINSGYVWRPGYWTRMRPDWVWVPAHYVWRPLGVVFISGYWDFAVSHRGILFAPVFFPYRVTVVSHRLFTPSYVIDLTIFSDLIFWRPRYHHYYFGDYYASKYYRRGIYPWCSFHAKRHGYNPIYAHERWVHRLDRNWEHRIQAKYDRRPSIPCTKKKGA